MCPENEDLPPPYNEEEHPPEQRQDDHRKQPKEDLTEKEQFVEEPPDYDADFPQQKKEEEPKPAEPVANVAPALPPAPKLEQKSISDTLYRTLIKNLYKNTFYRPGTTEKEIDKINELLMAGDNGSFILSDGRKPDYGVTGNWNKAETLAELYVKHNNEVIHFDISVNENGFMLYGRKVLGPFALGDLRSEEAFSNLLKSLAAESVISKKMVEKRKSIFGKKSSSMTFERYMTELQQKRDGIEIVAEHWKAPKSNLSESPVTGRNTPTRIIDLSTHPIITPFERTKRKYLNRLFRHAVYHPGITSDERDILGDRFEKQAEHLSYVLSDGRELEKKIPGWPEEESLAVLYVYENFLGQHSAIKRYDIVFSESNLFVYGPKDTSYGPYHSYEMMLDDLDKKNLLRSDKGIRLTKSGLGTYEHEFTKMQQKKEAENAKQGGHFSSLTSYTSQSNKGINSKEADDVPPLPSNEATPTDWEPPPPYLPPIPPRPVKVNRFSTTFEKQIKGFLENLYKEAAYHPRRTDAEEEKISDLLEKSKPGSFIISDGRKARFDNHDYYEAEEALAVLYVKEKSGGMMAYEITSKPGGLAVSSENGGILEGAYTNFAALYKSLAKKDIIDDKRGIKNKDKIENLNAEKAISEMHKKPKSELRKESKEPPRPF